MVPAIRKVPAKLSVEGKVCLGGRGRCRGEGGEGKLKINSHDGLKLYCHKSKIEFRLNKADEEPFLCLDPIDFAALMSQGTRVAALSRLSACPTPFPNLLITHDRKRDCGTGKGEGTSTILRALSSPLALYLSPLSVRPSVLTSRRHMAQCECLVKIISGIVSEHGWGAIKSRNVLGSGKGTLFSKQYTAYKAADRAARQSRRRRHKSLGTC